MIAIHIDPDAKYQAAAAYCADKGLEKAMRTNAINSINETADMYWTADDHIAKQYDEKGIKRLKQSEVDKWLKSKSEPEPAEAE